MIETRSASNGGFHSNWIAEKSEITWSPGILLVLQVKISVEILLNAFSPASLQFYRVLLNSHYRLCGLVMGTKTVKVCMGTHVRKHNASPLQTEYYRIICWSLPLLLLTVHCFSSGFTYKKGLIWRPTTSTHKRYLSTMFLYTRSPIPGSPTFIAANSFPPIPKGSYKSSSSCGPKEVVKSGERGTRGRSAGAGYGCGGSCTTRYLLSCVSEHGM